MPRGINLKESGSDLLQIVLRVIHIAAGIMWVGIAVFVLAFLQPAVTAWDRRAVP